MPLVLDRATDNYNRWRSMFLTVLGKYALTDHVVNADRPAWVQMNCTVLTWIYIYCKIHADLQQSTMNRKPTTRGACTYLENEFLGQRESRALLLSAEFRTAKQGSTSITDFCCHLETMAATLGDYSDPIGDRTLVLTLLRGLNGKFRPMVSNLKMRQPFGTFEEARTLLLLEEIDIDDITAGEAAGASDPPASSASTALVAAPRSSNGRGGNGHGGQGGYDQGASHGQPAATAARTAARPATARDRTATLASLAPSAPAAAVVGTDVTSSSMQPLPLAAVLIHRRHSTTRGWVTSSFGRVHRTVPGRRFVLRRLPSLHSSSSCNSRTAAVAALDAHAGHVLGPVRSRQQLQHHDADASSTSRMVC